MYLNQLFANLLLDESDIDKERVFTNFLTISISQGLWICRDPQGHIVTGK
jgi:hypothetical protein